MIVMELASSFGEMKIPMMWKCASVEGSITKMDRYLTIEFDSYGLTINGAQGYLSVTWLLMGIVAVSVVAYKIWKNRK